jgi:hypothetical protein
VEETAQWRRDGYASPAEWLAAKNGTSTGRARAELGTSQRLKDLPDTADALKDGRLSQEQADLISDAASANPTAEGDLLDAAGRDSVKNLKDECGRQKAAADPDPDARHRRLHRERKCRSWTSSEGAWNLAARGTVDAGAEFRQALDRLIDERFTAARRAGLRESRDAYAFDALLELARRATDSGASAGRQRSGAGADGGTGHGRQSGDASRSASGVNDSTEHGGTGVGGSVGDGQGRSAGDTRNEVSGTSDGNSTGPVEQQRQRRPRPNPKHLALIRVDLAALVRGIAEGDELCEITGLGPIPVRVARDLLGDSILKLVISRGVDVANVTHLGRGVNTAQQLALLWTDPQCRVEGCHRTRLQNDHRTGWTITRTTRLDDTDPLCAHHHDLKTYKGWALVAGEGRRPMVPPDDPRHPRHGTGSPPIRNGDAEAAPPGTPRPRRDRPRDRGRPSNDASGPPRSGGSSARGGGSARGSRGSSARSNGEGSARRSNGRGAREPNGPDGPPDTLFDVA